MPKNFYNGGANGEKYGDRQWIIEQIDKLPIGMQDKVKERYSDIFESLNGEENQRFRANTWLRMTVKKHEVKVDKNDIMF